MIIFGPPHDKNNKMIVRPAKTQISQGIWVTKDQSFFHADSEDSDQTGRMARLIWVFTGRTCHFVGFVMSRWKHKQEMNSDRICYNVFNSLFFHLH